MAVKRVKKPKLSTLAGKSIPRASSPDSTRPVYGNREKSWLAFNRRVLEQAQSTSNPLLERVKFLAIVSSNLDEFFEIRVAGLMQQADSEASELSLDGLTPREQLKTVHSDANVAIHAQDGYAITTHKYEKPGVYLAKVERTDRRGFTAVGRLKIVVNPK